MTTGRTQSTRFSRGSLRRNGQRRGYVLLETVVAVGLLVLGMSILGAQVQDADSGSRKMEMRMRALMLAEMQIAYFDTGLFEFDSVDEELEEDFGPRYKDFAWRLILEDTVTDELFRHRLDILYNPRETYDTAFEYDDAEILYTFYSFKAVPKPVNFEEDFGMTEEEIEDLTAKLEEIGIDGMTIDSFDPAILAKLESEELIAVLPLLADAFNIDISTMLSTLPPEVLDAIKEQGLLEGVGGGDEGSGADAP